MVLLIAKNFQLVIIFTNRFPNKKPRQPSCRLTGGVSLTNKPNNRIVHGYYILHTSNTKGYTFRYRSNVAIVSFIACA